MRPRHLPLCFAALVGLLTPVAASAQNRPAPRPPAAPAAAPAATTRLEIPVTRERLENGLRVVLSPDHSVPTVAVAVYYDVGARVEEQGRSGFAHLFEHLMFEGTEGLPKGEFDRLLALRGADANATTSEDRTNYYETLPASSIELGLFLEADRMRALAITAEAFENQRLTVMEERRQSYENRPYMLSVLERDRLFYAGYYPYEHSTIGDMADLQRATLADVRAFHARYYAPDNAVIAITGDFEPAAAMELVRRHFGPITARRGAPWTDPGYTPPGQERAQAMVDPLADAPAFHMVWHIPPRRTEDHYALELLGSILGGGESSRLHQRLVRTREMLAEVEVGAEGRRGPDMFALWAICAGENRPVDVRREVDAIIAEVISGGVTAQELQKAKNARRAGFVFGLESPLGRAEYLGMTELYDGDAGLVNTELARYEAVTVDDVRRVAGRYLTAQNRLVLDVLPRGATTSSLQEVMGRYGW
jgi:zinc protease